MDQIFVCDNCQKVIMISSKIQWLNWYENQSLCILCRQAKGKQLTNKELEGLKFEQKWAMR